LRINKFPPGTRIRTPSGRFARIQKYDDEGRVHVFYYDVEPGEEGLFPAKLIEPCDVIKAPDTHVPRETDGHGAPLSSDVDVKRFWAERTGVLPKFR
jgi:hypothetical protein